MTEATASHLPVHHRPTAGGNGLKAGDATVILAMADHNGLPGIDVLEALFQVADPLANARQIAARAMAAFGSVGAVFAAGVPELVAHLAIEERVAYALKAIHAGMRSALREPIRERVLIGSLTELIDYLALSLRHETLDVLRVLYFDCRNGLISDEEISRGIVDYVALHPRAIVRRALEHNASAVVAVYSHPSGDLKPSLPTGASAKGWKVP